MIRSTGRFTPELRRLMADSYDVCRSCAATLPREVAAYAGYGEDGHPQYVGECCVSKISELATHVYWWWAVDKRADASTNLWRYMDFAKFVDMLQRRAIYFSRADQLGDPFEGAIGVLERQPIWDSHHYSFFKNAIRSLPEGAPSEIPDEKQDQEARRLLQEYKDAIAKDRLVTFVSCWHANTVESEALWRLYSPPPSIGVAVKTTVQNLRQSLGDDPSIDIGLVQYVDFRTGFSGTHDRIFWKRKSLSHEAEVRAVINRERPIDETGIHIPADLSSLFLAVVPSPFAPLWFKSTLAEVIRAAGLSLNIEESELLAQPFF